MDIRIGIGRKDLKRLLELIGLEDKTFFVIALNSIIERELSNFARRRYDPSENRHDPYPCPYSQFEEIRPDLSNEDKEIFKRLKWDRILADEAVHGFEEMAMEDIRTTMGDFFVFLDTFAKPLKDTKEYERLKKAVSDIPAQETRIAAERRRFGILQRKIVMLGDRQLDYEAICREYADIEAKKRRIRKDLELEKRKRRNMLEDSIGRLWEKIRGLEKDLGRERREKSERRHEIEDEIAKTKDEINRCKKELEKQRSANEYDSPEINEQKKRMEEQRRRCERNDRLMEGMQSMRMLLAYSENTISHQKNPIVLSPMQKKIVDSLKRDDADLLVKGGAGSGKTIVLLELLKKTKSGTLFNDPSCRLLTYAKTLEHYTKTCLAPQLGMDEEDISTVDSLVASMTRNLPDPHGIVYPRGDKERMDYYEKVLQGNDKDCIDEIELFLWPNGVTKEEYIDEICPRRGMKDRLGVESRRRIWEAKERLEDKISKNARWPFGYAVKRILEQLELDPESFQRYRRDYCFVDECQDLTLSSLKLIKRLSNIAVYLSGDANQSIYKRARYRLKDAGINIEGRTMVLNECYRGTIQINDVCERYRKAACIDERERDMTSSREGLPVFVQRVPSVGNVDCVEMICKAVSTLLELDVDIDDICVLTYTNAQAKDVRNRLLDKGILAETLDREAIVEESKEKEEEKGCWVKKRDNTRNLFESDAVKVMTVFGSKGMEFPVVLLYGSESVAFAKGLDDEETEALKKNLVYVAATRATSYLGVFIDGKVPSKALDLFERATVESNGRFFEEMDV